MFGYVLERSEDDYVINVDLDDYGSGYNVVPKAIDPENAYDIEDVREYCKANPDKVLSVHPLEGTVLLEREKARHEAYISSTNGDVLAVIESGVMPASEDGYTAMLSKRAEARARINEINSILGG